MNPGFEGLDALLMANRQNRNQLLLTADFDMMMKS